MTNYNHLVNECIDTSKKLIFNLKNNIYLDNDIINLIIKLKTDHRYCPESKELDNLLIECCTIIEEKIVPQILNNEKFANLLTLIFIIFNSCTWYHKSKFYFIKNNIETSNHSFYKQAFAESVLGCGGHYLNKQCGVQFYNVEQLSEIKNKNINELNFFNNAKIYNSLKIRNTINNIFLISLDKNYFELFGIAQIVSIIENYEPKDNAILIALHLVNSYESENFNKLLDYSRKKGWDIFTIFYDYPNNNILAENIKNNNHDRRTYLACIRFSILHDIIVHTGKCVLVTDTDQFFQKKLEDTNRLNQSDISLIDHTQFFPRTSLYSKFGASYVEFNNNLNTLAYTNLLSDFLKINLIINPNWTLDQFALLYISLLYPNIIINRISPLEMYDQNSFSLYNMAGQDKFTNQKFLSRRNYLLDLMNHV